MDPGVCPECGTRCYDVTGRRRVDRVGLWFAGALALSPIIVVSTMMAASDAAIEWLSGGAPVGDPRIAHAAWTYGGVYFKWLPCVLLPLAMVLATWRVRTWKGGARQFLMLAGISLGGGVVAWLVGAFMYVSFTGGV